MREIQDRKVLKREGLLTGGGHGTMDHWVWRDVRTMRYRGRSSKK